MTEVTIILWQLALIDLNTRYTSEASFSRVRFVLVRPIVFCTFSATVFPEADVLNEIEYNALTVQQGEPLTVIGDMLP